MASNEHHVKVGTGKAGFTFLSRSCNPANPNAPVCFPVLNAATVGRFPEWGAIAARGRFPAV